MFTECHWTSNTASAISIWYTYDDYDYDDDDVSNSNSNAISGMTVILEHCHFQNNTSEEGRPGSAIFNEGGVLHIQDTSFYDHANGWPVEVANGGVLAALDRSCFEDNPGAVYIFDDSQYAYAYAADASNYGRANDGDGYGCNGVYIEEDSSSNNNANDVCVPFGAAACLKQDRNITDGGSNSSSSAAPSMEPTLSPLPEGYTRSPTQAPSAAAVVPSSMPSSMPSNAPSNVNVDIPSLVSGACYSDVNGLRAALDLIHDLSGPSSKDEDDPILLFVCPDTTFFFSTTTTTTTTTTTQPPLAIKRSNVHLYCGDVNVDVEIDATTDYVTSSFGNNCTFHGGTRHITIGDNNMISSDDTDDVSSSDIISNVVITGFSFVNAADTSIAAWGYSSESTATIRYCYFGGNRGEFGGAVNVYHESKDGMKVWLYQNIFVNNVAKYGSALLVEAGWANVTLCSFSEHRGDVDVAADNINDSDDDGWPIEVIFYGTLLLTDNCFEANIGTVWVYEEGIIEEVSAGNYARGNLLTEPNCNRGFYDDNNLNDDTDQKCTFFQGTECLVQPLILEHDEHDDNTGEGNIPTMAPVVLVQTIPSSDVASSSSRDGIGIASTCVGATSLWMIAAAYYMYLFL